VEIKIKEAVNVLTDVQIAQQAKMEPIEAIAEKLGVERDELVCYGKYKAKLPLELLDRLAHREDGKLILVTAINPTPAGEGKTTVTVGLGQAMPKIGRKAVIALREPSLGPVFGVKGGAAGGGYSQVVPMEEINLHFTGDMHAITAANNLLCALIDNHLQQGNALGIDPRRILFARVLDMNDRALRNVLVGLGGKPNGVPREDHFTITVASEVMAILCLATGLEDLKKRLGNILVAYTYGNGPVFARDLKADGAMTVLLKDAINPNLVQTLENTPALMHGGPFANIAHGCNSITATRLALKLGDYCITEAGFGSDLGAEKFLDIKCPTAGIKPSAIVIVATVKALKYNGKADKKTLDKENLEALSKGLCNLRAHVDNMRKYGVPTVVAVNRFHTDTDAELSMLMDYCAEIGVECALSEGFARGGDGVVELAQKVVEACEQPNTYKPIYTPEQSIAEKIEAVAKTIYGAVGVAYSAVARKAVKDIESLGVEGLRVCIAKTQYSLSDTPTLLGRPEGFTLQVTDVKLSAGAGFVVVIAGGIMTMPGLPKQPVANAIDIGPDGKIVGLF